MSQKITNAAANFETGLSDKITATDTSATLLSGVTADGVTLPTGLYGFTIDEGTAQEEHVIGTLTGGTALTGMLRGISPQDGITEVTALKKAHRRNASIKITNHPSLIRVIKTLQGTVDLDGTSPIAYDVEPTLVNREELATVGYVQDTTNGGPVSFDSQKITGVAGENLAVNEIVYFNESDQRWYKTDNDTSATYLNVKVGINKITATTSNGCTVQLSGLCTGFSGLTAGSKYYISGTAGAISTSASNMFVGTAVSTSVILMGIKELFIPSKDEKDAIAGGGDYGTPSTSNKFITQDYLNSDDVVRFGGTGADGVLNVTSGTTTIDLGGVNVFTKNYTTINISVGATVNFSNPASDGTIIIFKATGSVTIAGTLSAAGMGASGGAGGTGDGGIGANGTNGYGLISTEAVSGRGGGAPGSGTAGIQITALRPLYLKSANQLYTKSQYIYAGSGGGGGQAGDGPDNAPGGAGARGGGAILIECRGALNFTGVINTSGSTGTAGSNGTTSSGGGGGGGGGSAGCIVVMYNTLTANSGTLTSTGGASGGGGSGSGGDLSFRGQGGAGAGSFTAAGGAGAGATTNGNAGAGLGAGAGGGGGQTTGVATSGASGGATEGGLVIKNVFIF